MVDNYLKNHQVYKYAESVVNGTSIANWDVTKVCNQFLDEVNDDSSPYFFDVSLLKKIDGLFQYINMGTGSKQGQPVGESIADFQYFFIGNMLCMKHRKDPEKRKYETGIMLIARKNGKTFIVGLIFILLLLLEPKYSTFYSVAPDRELSSQIKNQIAQILGMSPVISRYFTVLRKEVRCSITQSTFEPLATSNDKLDGRLANVFLCDETAALGSNNYPLESMKSSQVGDMKNKTGIIISTMYPSLTNVMTEQVDMFESILRGEVEDKSVFGLIYKPDKPREWQDNDDELLKANPLSQVSPGVKDAVFKKRREAIMMPSTRTNFLTKHMNIAVDADVSEKFLQDTEIADGELPEPFDWHGKECYVGVDLALSNDNVSVGISTYDSDRDAFIAKSWAFYPAERQTEKTRIEHVDYALMDQLGCSFATGGKTVDYNYILNFILSLEDNLDIKIKGICYDRWNSINVINSLDDAGYDTFEIRQNASGLYPGTKLMREKFQNGKFFFDKNELLKKNFANATMVTDMNLSFFINKKKSNGKIDMVAALINTMAMWVDEINGESNQITGDSVFAL